MLCARARLRWFLCDTSFSMQAWLVCVPRIGKGLTDTCEFERPTTFFVRGVV